MIDADMTFHLSVTKCRKVKHINRHVFHGVRYNRKESETWCYFLDVTQTKKDSYFS